MADYLSKTDMHARAQDLFDFLADIGNLPRYFDRMTSAEPGDGESVKVTADLGGQRVYGEAWFHVDRDELALSWGSEGPNDYHGHLEVDDGTDTTCTVTITLTTARAAGPEIQRGLEQTAANIKRLIEER